MTTYTFRQGLSFKMPPVVRYLRVTTQAIAKPQNRLGMRFVAGSALKLHRRFGREGFPLQAHPRVTAKAQLSFRLYAHSLWNQKLMTCSTVKPSHCPDVGLGLCVTFDAVLRLRLRGVQGRKMTR